MPLDDDAIRRLILFNERVDRLDRSALAKRMEKPEYQLDYERMMRREWISADGVTEDAVDAFVCNIRLLIQPRDGISIQELTNNIYSRHEVPIDLRERFDAARQKWQSHFDGFSVISLDRESPNLTCGELFEILLYGGIAHANPDKIERFRILTTQGAFSSMVCGAFLVSLRTFLGVVRGIQEVNTDLMRRSQEQHGGGTSNQEEHGEAKK